MLLSDLSQMFAKAFNALGERSRLHNAVFISERGFLVSVNCVSKLGGHFSFRSAFVVRNSDERSVDTYCSGRQNSNKSDPEVEVKRL